MISMRILRTTLCTLACFISLQLHAFTLIDIENKYLKINAEPIASLTIDGPAELCENQCTAVIININQPGVYSVNIGLSTPLIQINNLPDITNVMNGDKVNVCYEAGNFPPFYQASIKTIKIPSLFAGFTYSFKINKITSPTGVGTVTGAPVNIKFLKTPKIGDTPYTIFTCYERNGTTSYDLDAHKNNILGTEIGKVHYYTDDKLTNEVFSPYRGSLQKLYAVIISPDDCRSAIQEIVLAISPPGNVGIVSLTCNDFNTSLDACEVCSDNVHLTIGLPSNKKYNIVLNRSDGSPLLLNNVQGPSAKIKIDPAAPQGRINFQFTSVQEQGFCPDYLGLGSELSYDIKPKIKFTQQQNLEGCESIMLPPIIGDLPSHNAAYYTMPFGQGKKYLPGELITSNTTLYIYDVTTPKICQNELLGFAITINKKPTIISANIKACDGYRLPPIQGQNLVGKRAYYSDNNFVNEITVGTIINKDTTLYIQALNGSCSTAAKINVDISPSITFDPLGSIKACNKYVLPPIIADGKTATKASYFDLPNGAGNEYRVGEEIQNNSVLYVYEKNNSCVSNSESISIEIVPGPSINAIPDITICNQYVLPNIQGNFLSPNSGYYTITRGGGEKYKVGDTIKKTTSLFAFDTNGTCGSENEFKITIDSPNKTGSPNPLSYCTSTDKINLFDLLKGDYDPDGTWSQVSGTPITITNTKNVDISNAQEGVYLFSYIKQGTTTCPITETSTVLTLAKPAIAGPDISKVYCDLQPISLSSLPININNGLASYSGANATLQSNTFTPNKPGQYNIKWTVGDGQICLKDEAEIKLTFHIKPQVNLEIENTVCFGKDLIYKITTDSSYFINILFQNEAQYSSGNQLSFIFQDSIKSTGINYGTIAGSSLPDTAQYHLTITNTKLDKCTYTHNQSIPFKTLPNPMVQIKDTLCQGETKIYGGKLFDENKTVDTLQISNANGCDTIYTISLKYQPHSSKEITINACDESRTYTYGGTTFSLTNPTGSVKLLKANQYGCDSTINVNINYAKLFSSIMIKNAPCINQDGRVSLVSTNLQLPIVASIPNRPYADTISQIPAAIALMAGKYNLRFVDADSCSTNHMVEIFTNPKPTVTIKEILKKDEPKNITYNSSRPLESIKWLQDSILSCTSCVQPEVLKNGAVILQYTYDDVCTDTLHYNATKTILERIFFPNVLSINSQSNNTFTPKKESNYIAIIKSLMIFDRWGNVMFKKENIDINNGDAGWDATFNGIKAQPGVYFYRAEVEEAGGKVEYYMGDVTVVE
jgi:hypothetical protein